ncbi:hypothetical protein MNBD_CHLOROFLEXI01-511 [hydrothermal vent metagenome]|uniref:Uncharacterized protein n=1 Tax=hydrothermal vent metagenome TaxID=652676 RepID=A0A3B0VDF2_9ZZZZ
MSIIRDYQDESSARAKSPPEHRTRQGVERGTSYLREVATRIGLAILSGSLLVPVSLASLLLFGGFLLSLPEYDYRVDARLGDHYMEDFSAVYPNPLGIPEMQEQGLSQPIVTDMAQTDERVFLATLGHGIQDYDKNNYLWKTVDAKSSGGEIKNDIADIFYQKRGDTERLWSVGMDGELSLGEFSGDDALKFTSLYGSSAWRYVSQEEISTVNMIDETHVVFGSIGKGAGVYNIQRHAWQDFPEIKEHTIKRIIYRAEDALLWFLTDQGVRAYAAVPSGDGLRMSFRFLPGLMLEGEDLVGFKVFAKDRAIALTADQGCYLFEGRWSNKLLGGLKIPGLTHEAIRHTAYWNDLLVVAGQPFGVAAYSPADRNWRSLAAVDGEFPAITDFDYDATTIAVATTNGVFVISPGGAEHLLADRAITNVSLGSDGLLYAVDTPGAGQLVGWIRKDGTNDRLIIGSDTLNIPEPPRINDVIAFNGEFWLASEQGVIRYRVAQRRLDLLVDKETGTLGAVRKIARYSGSVIVLNDDGIYRWQEGDTDTGRGAWRVLFAGAEDLQIDQNNQDLWVRYAATHKQIPGRLVRYSGEGSKRNSDVWFAGQGPRQLDLSETNAVMIGQPGGGFKAYFPAQGENKLYSYDSAKAIWAEPVSLPSHKITRFAPLEGTGLFSLRQGADEVYLDNDLLIGSGRLGWAPGETLASGKNGDTVTLYGPERKSQYVASLGKWSNLDRYAFLDASEKLTEVVAPAFGLKQGALVRTNRNRVFVLDEGWTSAELVGTRLDGEFDGRSFWRLNNGELAAATVTHENDKYALTKQKYFRGLAPNLTNLLAAWRDDKTSELVFVTSRALARYNTKSHIWKVRNISQGPLLLASRKDDKFEAVSATHIHTIKLEDFKTQSIRLPKGKFKKLNNNRSNRVVTVARGDTNVSFYRSDDKWQTFANERSAYKGNLNAIRKLFRAGDSIWTYEPSGRIGRYAKGSWRTYPVPHGFQLSAFMKNDDGEFFLVGKQQGREPDLPLYSLQGNRFHPLSPLPANVIATRIEKTQGKERYLWVKSRDRGLDIYDLWNPTQPALNIREALRSTRSAITSQLLVDLRRGAYTSLPLALTEGGWHSALPADAINNVTVERDEGGIRILLKTKDTISVVSSATDNWLLTAQYRVFGSAKMSDVLANVLRIKQPIDAANFDLDSADLRIAYTDRTESSIMRYLISGFRPGTFMDQSAVDFSGLAMPKNVVMDGIRFNVEGEQARFFVSAGESEYLLTHSDGRFEVDQPIMDVTVLATGKWPVIRHNNLVVYGNRSLGKVEDFGVFDRPLANGAFVDTYDGNLLLHHGGRVSRIELSGGKVLLEPFEDIRKIVAAIDKLDLSVFRRLAGVEVLIKGERFNGNARFPFDEIDSLAADKGRLYALTSDNAVWRFDTGSRILGSGEREALPESIASGSRRMITCTDRSVRLAVDDKLYSMAAGFDEDSSGVCLAPIQIAQDRAWRWRLDPHTRSMFFETRVADIWQARDRFHSGRFVDDRYTWLTLFDGRVYGTHGAGITRITKGGKGPTFITGVAVRELKEYDGQLYALTNDKSVFQLTNVDSWVPAESSLVGTVFGGFTVHYSNPVLVVDQRRGMLRFRTSEGDPVGWDRLARSFDIDQFHDFHVFEGQLFTISEHSRRLINYDRAGNRAGYHEDLGAVAKLRNSDDGVLLAVTAANTIKQWRETGTNWIDRDITSVEIAASAGLSFREQFENDATPSAIVPVVDNTFVQDFWSNGRFSFDRVRAITALPDNTWWAATDAGMVSLLDTRNAGFASLHRDTGLIARLGNINDQPIITGEDRLATERIFDPGRGEFVPATQPLFTRTVFDYVLQNDEFVWRNNEVAVAENRLPFQIRGADGAADDRVFTDSRFFWDQVNSAAYEDDNSRYWLITPQHMTINRITAGPALALADFTDASLRDMANQSLVDATFVDSTLFGLFVHGDRPSDLTDTPVESVRPLVGGEWREASETEYPFWQPAVQFYLESNEWTPTRMSHSAFHRGMSTFNALTPEGYQLFSPLDYASEFGKFSFDYVQSIFARSEGPAASYGDLVWAATRGGLIKLRYLPDEQRMVFDELLLEEDGLFDDAVDELKLNPGVDTEHKIWALLGSSSSVGAQVQELDIPAWRSMGESDDGAAEVIEQTYRLRGQSSYTVKYDPVTDRGHLALQWGETERTTARLLSFSQAQDPQRALMRTGEGLYMLAYHNAQYEFDLSSIDPLVTYTAVLTETVSQKREAFTVLHTDRAGFEWGTDQHGAFVLRLPGGDIYRVTGLDNVTSLNIDATNLLWASKDGDDTTTFEYDAVSGVVKIQKQLDGGVLWSAYECPPGMSISQYLLDHGIIEKQNFFQHVLGTEHTKLEEWVLLIAQRNSLKKRGSGKLDYFLEEGVTYEMPTASAATASGPVIKGSIRVVDREMNIKPLGGGAHLVETQGGVFAVAAGHLLRFDFANQSVELKPLPVSGEVSNIWGGTASQVMVSFAQSREPVVWAYSPQRIQTRRDVQPEAFRRIYVSSWGKTLEAAEQGVVVLDKVGNEQLASVFETSEWFFGAELGKVVSIQPDSGGKGYWITTERNGLVFTARPF